MRIETLNGTTKKKTIQNSIKWAVKRPLCSFFLFFFFYTQKHTAVPVYNVLWVRSVLLCESTARYRTTNDLQHLPERMTFTVILSTHTENPQKKRLTTSSQTQHSNANFIVFSLLFFPFPVLQKQRRITVAAKITSSPFYSAVIDVAIDGWKNHIYPDEMFYYSVLFARISLFWSG